MKRLELIANRSVESEVIEALEKRLNITIIPCYRKHAAGVKPGTYSDASRTGWEHMHGRKFFFLISYLDQEVAGEAEAIIKEVKQRNPCEWIRLLIM